MHVILSAVLIGLAILDLVIGTGFLVDPSSSGRDFGLDIANTHGASTLRGDMTAFFYVSAASMIWGAWRRRGDVLLAALAIFGVAFTGRAINLAVDGPYDGWMVPMGIEALHIIALLAAIRSWGWRRAIATGTPSAGMRDR